MALKKYNPYTPSRRFMTGLTFEEITTDTPHKPLLTSLRSSVGRDNNGRISVRHKG